MPPIRPTKVKTPARTSATTTPEKKNTVVTRPVPAKPAGVDGFDARGGAAAKQVPVGEKLFLSASGSFVGRSGQKAPVTPREAGEAIHRAAELSQDGTNLFAAKGITLEQKQGALAALTAAFEAGAAPGQKAFESATQALQVRSSAAPLLLDLAKSLDASKPAEKALQAQVVATYLKLLASEGHGLNRNFMIYDLNHAKAQLPAEVRPKIDELMREVAPLAPPYEEWFKGGNTKVKLDYYVGEGFWDEELSSYASNGFTRKDNADGTVTLSRHYEVEREQGDGQKLKFVTDAELVMHNGPEGMFDHMNDPTVQGIVYSGHANYGREVPSHLGSGKPMTGAKVFFGMQCGGKGIQNDVLGKYPDLQMVTSKNSSYGYQDRQTILNTLDGISQRSPWVRISEKNQSNSDNYYFPTDTLISKRALDQDHDGRADAWDRVVSSDTFHPQEAIASQLRPVDPKRPVEALDGSALHGAVLRFWRMAGYNQWADELKDEGVVDGGFFAGKSSDPLFRLTEVQGEDGQPVQQLKLNSRYAHASEEVLGAALHYELGRQWAEKKGVPKADAKAAGLLMAAKCLEVDRGEVDEAAWSALLAWAKLPKTVALADAAQALSSNDHSAGDDATLALFKASLAAKHVTL